jgi:hypothetical protein
VPQAQTRNCQVVAESRLKFEEFYSIDDDINFDDDNAKLACASHPNQDPADEITLGDVT